ncbi:MAG: phosphatidate cytidylyltransferase [Acidimicrobiia bacterium]|nr:phosphatidate cytidylyltransferase [Acidimicrobiia bacterium]
MTEKREERSDGPMTPPNEGVRIIGADEAAEAMDRDDVAQRRGGTQPRYGDRPAIHERDGSRPVLRFPLGSSSDPRDIARSAVAPTDPPSGPVSLPHWTEPPTGQVPQILPDQPGESAGDDEDWTSFATASPRWRDDSRSFDGAEGFEDIAAWAEADEVALGALDDRERPTHDDYFTFADLADDDPEGGSRSVFAEDGGLSDNWADSADDATAQSEQQAPRRRRRASAPVAAASGDDDGSGYRPRRAVRSAGGGGDRDMGQAAIVGVVLLGLALVLFKIGPSAAMVLVAAVVGLAAMEFLVVLRQAGYTPLPIVGIVASVGLVIGAYNNGVAVLPGILFLTLAVCLLHYLVGAAAEAPVMNIGVTLLAVLWVGLSGSFAGLMLGIGQPGIGILLAAIIGTVGYDLGGLVIGRNAGSKPLSNASPNKTVEGLVGGMVVAVVVVTAGALVVGFGPINGFVDGLLAGLVIALAAPLGDLCESLIKRDLGIKDMGSILPGHGGVLDRFDAMLFVLPALYLLASVRHFFL